MNKKFFTHALALLIGGGLGYLVAKKMLEDYYAELAQEEIDSVKEMYERKLEKAFEESGDSAEMTQEQYEERHGDKSEPESKKEEKTASIDEIRALHKEGYTVTEIADQLGWADNIVQSVIDMNLKKSPLVRQEAGSKVAYHQMAKENMREQLELPKDSIEHHNVFKQAGPRKEIEPSDEEVEEPDEPQGYTARDLSEIDRTSPYVISADEYNDEFVEHDKSSIYYYMVDDVLCDEHEEIMDDIANTVGYDVFRVLENQPTAWVRNERLAIDYEICVVRSSYAEVVQGVPHKALSPREQYQNRQRRRPNDDE